MTEDMLEEQAEILTQLGTSEEGARVRAQMQCASLLSDMEAFKVNDSDPYRPFPSHLLPLCLNETSCEAIHMEMSFPYSFIFMQIKIFFI